MSVIYIHYGKRELKPCTVTFIMWLRPLSTLSLSLWNTEKDGRHVTTSSYCTNQRQTIQNTRADVVIAERNRTWEQYIWGVLHLIPPDMSDREGFMTYTAAYQQRLGRPNCVPPQWLDSETALFKACVLHLTLSCNSLKVPPCVIQPQGVASHSFPSFQHVGDLNLHFNQTVGFIIHLFFWGLR